METQIFRGVHASTVLQRLVTIRDDFRGLIPLVPTILFDESSGYFALASPSSTVQFYTTRSEAEIALAKIS